jgi:hypothetical protein
VLHEVNAPILFEEVFPSNVTILCDDQSNLRQEEWRRIAEIISLKEEIQITWKHDDIPVGQINGQMLNQRIMSLTQRREMQEEFLVVEVFSFSDIRFLEELNQTIHKVLINVIRINKE